MHETPWLIVPMAGFGQRFKDAGYIEEKPWIKAGGKTLLAWSLSCVPESWQEEMMIPVIRAEQTDLMQRWGRAVVLRGPTQGAACTVLAAAVGLPPDDPVAVMNADQWFKVMVKVQHPEGGGLPGFIFELPDTQAIHDWAIANDWDGFILTFRGTGPAWSYAVTNGSNRVVHVIEKKQVSPYATVGFYWWRRAADLVRSICAMIAVGQKTNQEFYLAPSFNFLPLSDKNVRIVEVEEFHGLGTPEQVKEFEGLLAEGWKP